MNPQDPLANLQPLRQPELIGWWPLAPGWWLLLGLVIITLVALAYVWRRHRQRNAYRRQALRRLESLYAAYSSGHDTPEYILQLNALLKSVALRAYPPEQVAAAHGSQWRTFINQGLPASLQLPQDFDTAAYRKTASGIDVPHVQQAAYHWISKHKATR